MVKKDILRRDSVEDLLDDVTMDLLIKLAKKAKTKKYIKTTPVDGMFCSQQRYNLVEVLESELLPYGFKAYGYPLEIMFFEGEKKNSIKIKNSKGDVIDLEDWIGFVGVEQVESIDWISNLEKSIIIINDEYYTNKIVDDKYELLDRVFITEEGEVVYVTNISVGYTFHGVDINKYLAKLVKELKTC